MIGFDNERKRVAIYARVSTEHEAQISALENQLEWYQAILNNQPNWILVDRYIDEGITGTSAMKRPEFLRMVEDAKDGKFDMVITREVSRFARNTVDTLSYARLLNEYGVEIYFLNDGIRTFASDGELRLSLFATFAQDESRKISERVKAGQQISMHNGVLYGNGNILGYRRIGKELIIDPEQAQTVRMIFDMYLSGMGVTKIQYELERLGRLTSTYKTKWFASYISRVLRNSFYCGIIAYHKEYTPNYLKQKKIKNYGEVEMITVKGSHTPIVTEEEFYQVQEIMSQRSQRKPGTPRRIGIKPHTTVWGRLLVCQCGNKFNQHFHNRSDRDAGVDYQCYTSVNRGSQAERERRGLSIEDTCDSPFIPGWKLNLMAKYVFDNYIENADKVLELAYMMLESHIADQEEIVDHSYEIEWKQREIERLHRKRSNLIEMREEGDIDAAYFRKRKDILDADIAKLTKELETLQSSTPEAVRTDFTASLNDLCHRLESYVACDTRTIPENVVEAFIERIWVSKDEFRWYLRRSDAKGNDENFMDNRLKIAEFTISLEQAKEYQYSFSKKKRIYNWVDLHVSVWL